MHWDTIPHQLELCPNCIQDSTWVSQFPMDFQWIFQWICTKTWCTFDTFTNFYSVASYNSHFRIRLGNCSIADQSFGIDMLDSFGSSNSGREKCCPASPAYRTDAVLSCVSSLPLFVFALRFFDTVCPSATSVLSCFSSPLSCPSFFFSSLTPPAPLYSAQQWFPDLTLFENLQNPAPLRCPRSCMALRSPLSLRPWKNPAPVAAHLRVRVASHTLGTMVPSMPQMLSGAGRPAPTSTFHWELLEQLERHGASSYRPSKNDAK